MLELELLGWAIDAKGRIGRDWGNECLRVAGGGLDDGKLVGDEDASGEDMKDDERSKGEGYAVMVAVAGNLVSMSFQN